MGDPIPLLEALIKIDSSTKEGVNEAMDFCAGWLEGRGLSVEVLENNGLHILVCEIGEGDKTIVMNGHIDVIEGNEEQFKPYIVDGKMYGRGAVDMKAGVAASMETMAQLKDSSLGVKVMLQIVPDEETGGHIGTKYLVDNGYLGDFIICGEPTNMGIAIQAKGVLQLDLEISGDPAHGSRPWEGSNAILNAIQTYEKILELPFAQESSPMFERPSINLARIDGGTVYNKVPDKCRISLDIRYLPGQSPDEVLGQIEEVVDGSVNVHGMNRAVETEEDNPFVQALAESLRRQTDVEDVKIFGQHGSNDGQFFTEHGGDAIEFGPSGYDWHGDEELVYVDSVRDYQKVLQDFILSFESSKKEQTS